MSTAENPRRDRLEAAFGLMAGGMLLLPVGDTLSKLLTDVVAPVEITFWRFLAQTLVLGLATAAFPGRRQGSALAPLIALGGVTTAGTLLFLILAFSRMPIATAIVIFFVEPLLLTLLSALILKEKTGWRRYAAIAVGMLGAVVVIRPNWSTFGIYAIFPLVAALSFALNMIIVRHLSRTHSALTIQSGMAAYATLLLGAGLLVAHALGIFTWTGAATPLYVWPTYLLMGMIAGLTYLLLSTAFSLAPASVLAPVQYIEIVGATLMGYLVFGDFPDRLTWLGTAIILASGLYVYSRERRQRATAP